MAPQGKPQWRLSKTLARHRKIEFRPIENEDLPYAWAAYRTGTLKDVFEDGLTAEEFKAAFEAFVLTRYDAAWTLIAETKKGLIPVGIVLGFWPHEQVHGFMVTDRFLWFPWSRPRNRIESAVNFINSVKAEIPMLGFAKTKDIPFFNMLAQHGILRRIGTSHSVFKGERASVWETN